MNEERTEAQQPTEVEHLKGWLEDARQTIKEQREQIEAHETTIAELQAVQVGNGDNVKLLQGRVSSLCTTLDREEQRYDELEEEHRQVLITMEQLLKRLNNRR